MKNVFSDSLISRYQNYVRKTHGVFVGASECEQELASLVRLFTACSVAAASQKAEHDSHNARSAFDEHALSEKLNRTDKLEITSKTSLEKSRG